MNVLALALAAALAAGAEETARPAAPADAPAAAPAQPAPEAAEAVRKAMARELPALEPKRFETPAGLSGAVEAAAAPEVQQAENMELVTIPIGTSQAISCTLTPSRLSPAVALRQLVESVKEKVTVLGAQLTEVVAVDGSPLALGVAVYQATSEKGPAVGLLKMAVYVSDARSGLCFHDEPGYRETFARVVKGFVASLKGGAEDPRAGARFSEVSVMRLGEVPVGFSERVLWARDGGGRTTEEYSAQFVPRGPADLVAVDGFSREEMDAKDLLVKGTYVHVSNGELDTKMTVTRAKDGKSYGYDGEKDGKKLAGTFKTKAGLSTEFWFARRLAGAAPVPKKPLAHEAYSHEANPAAAIPVSYAAVASAPRRASMKLGPMQIEGDLDANGLFESAEIPVGPTKLLVRRIWVRGTP